MATTHDRDSLVRLVLDDSTEHASVIVDAAGGAFGRGIHVHPSFACLEKAARGGIARSLKKQVNVTARELADAIRDAYARRATGLLVAARRQRKTAMGADASVAELQTTPDAVVVVANDAAHAATLAPVQKAVADGRAVVWLNRAELGSVFGRDEVAVCVVTDRRIGAELIRACGMQSALGIENARAANVGGEDSRGEACRSREVR